MAMQNELAPNTTEYHQGRLAYVPDDLIPPVLAGPILDKIQDSSKVLRLGRRIPVSYNGTTIPMTTRYPAVGQVGVGTTNAQREGYLKPLSGMAWDTKTFAPIKLATIVTASEEMARTNPQGLFTQQRNEMANAMGRAFDLAVLHGVSPLGGTPLVGIDANNVLANTTNTVTFDYNENIYEELVTAYGLVTEVPNTEFDNWVFDPRVKARLIKDGLAKDTNGDIIDVSAVNMNQGLANILGFPAMYARAVGGDLDDASDTGIRGFGGDFRQLLWGMADEIRFKITDQATLTDGNTTVGLWQTNQVAVMIECTFGWMVGDLDNFVKIEQGTDS